MASNQEAADQTYAVSKFPKLNTTVANISKILCCSRTFLLDNEIKVNLIIRKISITNDRSSTF